MSLSRDIVRELFEYKEGSLYWRQDRGAKKVKGCIAGTVHSKGYIAIKLNGNVYKAHRLVYIWHYGHLPSKVHIDHINGDRSDNRIENLRKVTPQENQWNRKDVAGFSKMPSGKYRAKLTHDGKEIHLGVFPTKQEAADAYLKEKEKLHMIKTYTQEVARGDA